MKFNIIHQPRRSGKTIYTIRKAYNNFITGKSTLIFPLYEREFFGQMINYLNKKKINYYIYDGTIFPESCDSKNKDMPCINISNVKYLKKEYDEYKKSDGAKDKYSNVFFDDIHNNFFKKAEEIYKMLNTVYEMKNIPEIRFTYQVMLNQKKLELKQLKRLVLQKGISYKEIQSDTKLNNYYNNNDTFKRYYEYEENPLPYEIEVIGKLLDTIVVKCDMARRKELLEIIALSNREDEICNAVEELRDMEV